MRPSVLTGGSRRRRPSAAVAISLVALFVALGGSAVAASHYLITSTKQIKPSVLSKLTGRTGPRGLTGAQGNPGAPGSARAVAVVNADGSLEQGVGFPKNISDVSHTPNSGLYCVIVSGSIGDTGDAMASLNDDSSPGDSVYVVRNTGNCADGQVEVDTTVLEQTGNTKSGAQLNAVPSDAGFIVLVP